MLLALYRSQSLLSLPDEGLPSGLGSLRGVKKAAGLEALMAKRSLAQEDAPPLVPLRAARSQLISELEVRSCEVWDDHYLL